MVCWNMDMSSGLHGANMQSEQPSLPHLQPQSICEHVITLCREVQGVCPELGDFVRRQGLERKELLRIQQQDAVALCGRARIRISG